MSDKKTSTFVMHHDRCKPAEWGLAVWQALADFARTGDLRYAAALSRHGLQLLTSEHHRLAGGTLQHIGYVAEGDITGIASDNLIDICEESVTAVVPVYRGPTKYAAAFAIDDGAGNIDGHDFDLMDTEDAAHELLAYSMAAENADGR